MGMVYQWKPGSRVKIDAQVAGERLEKIRARRGGSLTPAAVVQDARSERSPLHPAFEWDDRRAAESYRIEQAKYLLRSVEVVVREDEAEPVVTRAFVSVVQDDEPRFTSVSVAMSDPALRDQVLARALSELRAFQAKYRDLAELAPVFEALEQMRVAA